MMTNEDLDRVRGWFTGRLPEEWKVAAPDVTVDREEITVIVTIADPASGGAADGAPEAPEAWPRPRRTRRGWGGSARSARTPAASG